MCLKIKRLLAYLTAAAAFMAAAAPPMTADAGGSDIIRWVDFNVTAEVLAKAVALDIEAREKESGYGFIELLAYLAAKNGNKFSRHSASRLEKAAKALEDGTELEELTRGLKYYDYYLEAFGAVLGGFVGDYVLEVPDGAGGTVWEHRYGVKVFSPIAKHFSYSHTDDFGKARSYAFSRTHLGNDLCGSVGTPVIAVEGGTVEALGWNRFGGWRIGIRSFDRKRYYYYAHLRKDFPFRKDLSEGMAVSSGDVIGYMGRSGYSRKENVNNINTVHLHFGMQLIFDESQKECLSEIWIDVYQIVRFLDKYRSEVVKDPETKDYRRVYGFRDLSAPGGVEQRENGPGNCSR